MINLRGNRLRGGKVLLQALGSQTGKDQLDLVDQRAGSIRQQDIVQLEDQSLGSIVQEDLSLDSIAH